MNLERLALTKLLDPVAMREAWDLGLRREVFEDPLNQEVYDFSVGYWLDNGMSSVATRDVLHYEYPAWKSEESVAESTKWLVDALKRRHASNQVQDLMRSAAQITTDDPTEALNQLFQGSWTVHQSLLTRSNRVDMSQNVRERRRRYTEIEEVGFEGAPIGFSEIDAHTGGILPGELAAVAARAKVGKSWMLVQAAVEARRAGYTPCVFTLEMSVEEMEDRTDALFSGVSYQRLNKKQLDFSEQKKLREAQEELASLGPFYIEQPERGERTVQHLVNRARQLGATFLVIDQLSFMEAKRYYQSVTDSHAEIIHDLKEEISNSVGGKMPTYLAVQMNRGAAGIRGELHNIANSTTIEQTVDIAYGLYRDKELRANDCMVVDILGSRRTDPKSWLLGWQLDEESRLFVRQEYEE